MEEHYLVIYSIDNGEEELDQNQTIVIGLANLSKLLGLFSKSQGKYDLDCIERLGLMQDFNSLVGDLTFGSLPDDLNTGNFE